MKYAISSADVSQSKGFYSQATTAGRLIFISGQTGIYGDEDPAFSYINQHSTYTQVSLSIAEQTENIIAIFMKLLDEVNCTLSDIAQLTILLPHLTIYLKLTLFCRSILTYLRLRATLRMFVLYLIMLALK